MMVSVFGFSVTAFFSATAAHHLSIPSYFIPHMAIAVSERRAGIIDPQIDYMNLRILLGCNPLGLAAPIRETTSRIP